MYTGPPVDGIFADKVFFNNGNSGGVGDEILGVRIININAPWTVTLGHKGGEYEVSVFGNDAQGLFDGGIFASNNAGSVFSGSTSSSSSYTPPSTPSAPVQPASTPSVPRQPGSYGNAEIPEPLTDGDIQAMTRQEAQQMLSAVSRARQRSDIDSQTRKRLAEEFSKLLEKIRQSR